MHYPYNIIIRCTDNNAIINNNYGKLQDFILLFKIPTGTRKKKYSKSIENLGTCPQKGSSALGYRNLQTKPDKSVDHAAACWPQTGSTPLSLFWVLAMVLKVACRRLTTRLKLKDTSPLYFQFHAVSADTPQFVCIEKKQCMD